MFSAFRIGPAASGHGLCDIDRVLFRVTESRAKKLRSPGIKILSQHPNLVTNTFDLKHPSPTSM